MQSKDNLTAKFSSGSTTIRTNKKKEGIDKRERAIFEALDNIDRSNEVDLCFVLDCTGSMKRHISAAKDCILKVTEHIRSTNPSIKIRFGFCGYRDHCVNSSRLQIFDFTNSCEKFRENLATVKTISVRGSDPPEDVLGGLNAAITQLTWNNGTKVLLHVGDCPPHGRRFTDLRDNHPDGDPYGLTAENVLEKMRSERILYFFGKITEYTDEMIKIFRSIIGDFPVFDLVGGDPLILIDKFVKTTVSSITISVSLTSTLGNRTNDIYSSRQRLVMNPDVPNWDSLSVQKGETLCFHKLKTLDELKDQRFFRKDKLFYNNFCFKIASRPFSNGTEKCAYFAISANNGPSETMVMKQFKKTASVTTLTKYLEAMEVSDVTNFLSKRFNLIAKRNNISLVNFLRASLVRVNIDGKNHFYIQEKRLQNVEFKRFNTNGGISLISHPTLEAFAHFTYEHTEGYLLVCDLQGVELNNEFLLTDPAIHCIDNSRFGRTNLGSEGIKRCFSSNHKCNEICKKLGLGSISKNV